MKETVKIMKIARNPIIAALDVSTAGQALALVEKLKGSVGGFKVGSELFTSAGPRLVRSMVDMGVLVFLDLKFHDIPNTVAKAVAAATKLGVGMLNVHTSGGLEMMKAAKQAAMATAVEMGTARPLVLGVTLLTSIDDAAASQIGFGYTVRMQVERLAGMAVSAGLDGLICSAKEVALLTVLVFNWWCRAFGRPERMSKTKSGLARRNRRSRTEPLGWSSAGQLPKTRTPGPRPRRFLRRWT